MFDLKSRLPFDIITAGNQSGIVLTQSQKKMTLDTRSKFTGVGGGGVGRRDARRGSVMQDSANLSMQKYGIFSGIVKMKDETEMELIITDPDRFVK